MNWTCEGLKPKRKRGKMQWLNQCELNLWGIETYKFNQFTIENQFVWIEPVRDWNNFVFKSWSKLNSVWIEPVRDWNFNCPVFISLIVKVCELNLWGIETPLRIAGTWVFEKCELNLWGIETEVLFLLPPCHPKVWIEPVRDWNQRYERCYICGDISVNWTCEGLKLVIFPLLITT